MQIMQLRPIRVTRQDDYIKPDFIIPGLRAGQVGLLVAPGGTGKSFLGLEIGLQVAGAENILPHLSACATGPVRVLSFEDDEVDLRNRLLSILRFFSVDMPEDFYCHSVCSYPLKLIKSGGEIDLAAVEWLKDAAEGMRLVICDPLSHIHGADENSTSDMTLLLQILKKIAAETKSGFLLVHHANKAAILNGQAALQQATRGASALVDTARLVLTLEKEKDCDGLVLNCPKINGHAPLASLRLQRGNGGVLSEGGEYNCKNGGMWG